jgi:hypothetical protein
VETPRRGVRSVLRRKRSPRTVNTKESPNRRSSAKAVTELTVFDEKDLPQCTTEEVASFQERCRFRDNCVIDMSDEASLNRRSSKTDTEVLLPISIRG